MPGLFNLIAGAVTHGPTYFIYPGHFEKGIRQSVKKPSQYRVPAEEFTLKTPDGVSLHAYLLLQRRTGGLILPENARDPNPPLSADDRRFIPTRPTVLILHGNGGNIGTWLPHAVIFHRRMRCNVLLLEYRGYGKSEGYPSESGIQIDGELALSYIRKHELLSRTPIILYGQSFGGAVAIDLAKKHPTSIRAIILENTYLSIRALVPRAVPMASPFAALIALSQKWDSASKIGKLPRRIDVLMLSGLEDEIVPPDHMAELWRLLSDKPPPAAQGAEGGSGSGSGADGKYRRCRFVKVDGGGHNNTSGQAGYWEAVVEFLESMPRN